MQDIIKHHILPRAPLEFLCVSRRLHAEAALALYRDVKMWHHKYYPRAIMALGSSGCRHLIASFTRTACTYELPTGYDWRRLPHSLCAIIFYHTKRTIDVLIRYQDDIDADLRAALDLYNSGKPLPRLYYVD